MRTGHSSGGSDHNLVMFIMHKQDESQAQQYKHVLILEFHTGKTNQHPGQGLQVQKSAQELATLLWSPTPSATFGGQPEQTAGAEEKVDMRKKAWLVFLAVSWLLLNFCICSVSTVRRNGRGFGEEGWGSSNTALQEGRETSKEGKGWFIYMAHRNEPFQMHQMGAKLG